MKKLLAILMCVALLVSLAACGSDNNNGGAGNDIETEAPIKKEISRGTISGDVYTNDFAGFTFTKTADWNFYTDEELAQHFNESQADADLNLIEEALVKNALIYDMAVSDDEANNVAVYYENTKYSSSDEVTIDEYIADLKEVLDEDEGDGFIYTHVATEDVKLGSSTFKKLQYAVSLEGITVDQAYYVKIVDQYAVIVMLTAGTASLESLEAMFS